VDNQIDEIKQKINIVDVINRYVPLKKRGRHHIACCPFHGEKTPSFTVSEELQIYKCFGCGKAGDVFNFLQEYEKIDFKEALQELAKQAGVVLVHSETLSHEEQQKKTLTTINAEVAKFYNYILMSHPIGKKAMDYVLERGITKETIKKFQIGFAPQNSMLLVNYLLKKGFKAPQLIATGTFGQSQYGNHRLYDRFQDRLTFPLTDYRDRILGFSGRILPISTNPNLAKYINSPETEIYHKSQMLFGMNLAKEAIRLENSVIVVEGEFDMISPYQAGIKNIVALKGTAFTQEQLQLLRRYTDTLILGLDSDFAGNNAARKSIELADSLEFDIKVLTLGDKYKDPDEAVKGDLNFFKSQLQNTIPVWDFIIQSVSKINDPSTIKGKKEILSQVLPVLVKINNSVIKADYFRKLANEIGSDEESVYLEAQKYVLNPTAQPSHGITVSFNPTPVEPTVNSKTEKFEELLMTLIFGAHKPDKLAKKIEKHLDVLSVSRFKSLIKVLLEEIEYEPRIYQEHLPAELRPVFQNLYLNATAMEIDSQQRLNEIKKTLNQVNIIVLKDKIQKMTSTIARLENSSNEEELRKTELEYNQLLIKLSKLQTKRN
jgi:DNA primase